VLTHALSLLCWHQSSESSKREALQCYPQKIQFGVKSITKVALYVSACNNLSFIQPRYNSLDRFIMQALSILMPIAAYLVGSISTAIIVCKVMRLPDPRETGSGNPGATNVLRVGGKGAAAITLAGDALKGFVPVLIASRMELAPWAVGATALAAVLGHVFPVFFKFRGGKGVATGFGAIFGIAWITGLMAITTWLALSLSTRISSIAALGTMVLLPLYIWITSKSVALTVCGIAIACLIFIRHNENIRRFLKGEEPQIGKKKS